MVKYDIPTFVKLRSKISTGCDLISDTKYPIPEISATLVVYTLSQIFVFSKNLNFVGRFIGWWVDLHFKNILMW
ncbi:hypothetical protein VPH184E373B_0161 [Vibrio phage 184E37-3b]